MFDDARGCPGHHGATLSTLSTLPRDIQRGKGGVIAMPCSVHGGRATPATPATRAVQRCNRRLLIPRRARKLGNLSFWLLVITGMCGFWPCFHNRGRSRIVCREAMVLWFEKTWICPDKHPSAQRMYMNPIKKCSSS